MAYNNQGQPQIPPHSVPTVYYAALEPYYAKRTSTVLGVIQILAGCVSIAAGSMAFAFYAELWQLGTGIWCGIFYLISGSIATAAGQESTNQLITTTVVLSAFDILFGVAEFTIASIGVATDFLCSVGYYYDCPDSVYEAIAANSMMIVTGTLFVISGSWLMAVSCRAINKGNKTQVISIPVAPAGSQPERMFIQEPTFQPSPQPPPQPPPLQSYYGHQQYPSIPSSQHMMYPGAQQTPQTIMKPEIRPPRY